jgi:hypothetical protein
MGSQLQAGNARSVGNYGLWESLRRTPPNESDANENDWSSTRTRGMRWLGWRARVLRWSLAAGGFAAYANHWPGGH